MCELECVCSLQNLSADNGVFEGLPTHYGLNLVNQKITVPRDDNYSDDELAFLPYFTYFFSSRVSCILYTAHSMFVCVCVCVCRVRNKGPALCWRRR